VVFVKDGLNAADTTAKEIEKVMTKPRELLKCKKCKMRREPTEENKALFGYKKDGKLYSNCIKCRIINQKYKQSEIVDDSSLTTNDSETIRNLNQDDIKHCSGADVSSLSKDDIQKCTSCF